MFCISLAIHYVETFDNGQVFFYLSFRGIIKLKFEVEIFERASAFKRLDLLYNKKNGYKNKVFYPMYYENKCYIKSVTVFTKNII